MKKEKILLIDANALVHRAFHALPPLTTKRGEIINAVYGFSMILLKAIKDVNPEYVAVAFDLPEPTFRHKEYKEYKATRQKAPDELKEQFPKVKEVVASLGIPIFEKPGYEADDIVGTLSKKAEGKNLEAIIVTGDLDELQLVSPSTKVYTMKRGFTDTVLYDEEKVKERYSGLTPREFIDYKALRGDPSDNIPGVPGIGEKTAIELIKNFKSVENLYKEIESSSKKIDSIKPKTLEYLKANKKQAKISKYLVKIVSDIPLELNLDDAHIKNYNRENTARVFKKYEFRTLLSKIPLSNNPKTENKENDFDFEIINTEKQLKELIIKIKKQNEIVIDTETETLDAITGKLVGISLSFNEKKAFYIPIDKNNEKTFLKLIKPVLENEKIKKIGHNLKYDLNVLKNCGIELKPLSFDTMIGYYLLHPGDRRFNLDDLSFSELGYEKIHIDELIGKGKNQKSLRDIPIEQVAKYSSEDSIITFRLYQKIKPELEKDKTFELFKNIEMPIVQVLAKIEKNGVKIDTAILNKMSKKYSIEIKNLEEKICKTVNCSFNINSPIQLKKILYQDLRLQEKMNFPQDLKKLKSGGFSTASGMLEKLKGTHKIIGLIQTYRELTKLKNTYIDALPKLINKKTGRVHTSFNQTVTATGRLSSSDPNIQNIPIRTEAGREIRKAFIAQNGYKLISADYSQIELRIIAHLSGDKSMIDSFLKHEDIHTRTAAEVNEVTLNKVTYEMRSAAKATNFGIVYGIGPHGLSEQLGWDYGEAKKYIDKYYAKHPQLISFLKQTIEKTKKTGYAETLFGRKRYLPEINSPNFQIRAAAERMAINFPAQGTAADFIKKAMIEINNKMPKKSQNSKMILQVHDELVFETPISDIKKIVPFIEKNMESVYEKLAVPIQVDISYGSNWKEMKNIVRGDKRKTKGYQH